ncbi:hypothetical protein M885DRAFT_523979 [Pelagophyceae sp. CCMP2097]|nr:hypothetical protein M885DRAFT_523979 [Pelagophyceae sp. CCMP2097]
MWLLAALAAAAAAAEPAVGSRQRARLHPLQGGIQARGAAPLHFRAAPGARAPTGLVRAHADGQPAGAGEPPPTKAAAPLLITAVKCATAASALYAAGSACVLSASPRTDAAALLARCALQDTGCAVAAVAGAVVWIKLWSTAEAAGLVAAKVSRKIIHCATAPLFLMVWPFFSTSPYARLIAAAAPLLQVFKIVAAGNSDAPNDIVRAVSRSGNNREVLGGPLLYTGVLFLATLLGWRGSAAAAVAVAQMAVGDGIADIVGRRFGRRKWSFNTDKSPVGTLAFFCGASLATLGLFKWFSLFGSCVNLMQTPNLVLKVAAISATCAAVEVAPAIGFLDDNLSVPLAGCLLGLAVFRS